MTERQPDELWTEYLKRRLKEEGVNMSEWEFGNEDNDLLVSNVWLPPIVYGSISEPSVFLALNFDREQEEGLLERELSYSSLPNLINEYIAITFPFSDEGYAFNISKAGRIVLDRETVPFFAPFSRYKVGETYEAKEVIDSFTNSVKALLDMSKKSEKYIEAAKRDR